jgi:CRISPR/Cas system-associated exonuclease Cas4 (RecB family)
MNINFHSWKDYKLCPKKYYLCYIEEKESVKNDYFALYGKLVQKFFEMFCNIWKYKTPHMFPEALRVKLEELYNDLLRVSTVNWNTQGAKLSKDDIFEQAYKDICIIMDSNNQNYFLNTKSEVEIEAVLNNEITLKGRLDFIYRNPLAETDCVIDGKGSEKITNVDNNQLYFYALLYYLHFKMLPEAGFFYYKYNMYSPIEITMEILNKFKEDLSKDIILIQNENLYKATPGYKSCRYCDYSNSCQEKMQYKKEHARPSKLNISNDLGIIEFSL